MKAVLLYRYFYKSRYYYAAVLFFYIAALSCGISCAGALADKAQIYSYTAWSLLLKTAVPLVAIGLGGLFFAGSVLIVSAVCYSAYTCGFIIGTQFAVSFWSGIAYVFFSALPLGIVYMCLTAFASVTALQCNAARYKIRRKGLQRPMTNYEIRQYIGKIMITFGADIVMILLEYYVFAAAYVNLLV